LGWVGASFAGRNDCTKSADNHFAKNLIIVDDDSDSLAENRGYKMGWSVQTRRRKTMTTPKSNKISVLIVDDHPPLRAGVRVRLEKAPYICVVGEAGNGDDAKKILAELRPKIVLLDLKMPNFSPADFEKWARENYPETVPLVLTGHDRDAYLSTMLAAGAAGYLDKTLRAGQLISSI
jgi:CheY-like chemotaxis protein